MEKLLGDRHRVASGHMGKNNLAGTTDGSIIVHVTK